MIGYSTGIDWSGDPGRLRDVADENLYLVFVGCHATMEEEASVSVSLDALRSSLGFDHNYVFKYAKTQSNLKEPILECFERLGLRMTALSIDKRNWGLTDQLNRSGPVVILDAIEMLIEIMPSEVVMGQRLLVDMNRSEPDFMRELKRASKRANLRVGRRNFTKIAPRPDHRSDAQLIQIADIIAGHMRRQLHREGHVSLSGLKHVRR